MPDITLPVSMGNLPEGICPISEQERANAIAAAAIVTFPFNYVFINTGSTAPTADNRIYPWDRSNPDGTPDKLYRFLNGQWISPHPIPPSSAVRFFYEGTEASIATYDGGEVGSVTTTTGPMWEVATSMSGRMALGASADFAQGTTGGADEVTLVAANLPAHSHDCLGSTESDDGGTTIKFRGTRVDNDGEPVTLTTEDQGSGTAVNVMNPFLVGHWIKRTARGYYRL